MAAPTANTSRAALQALSGTLEAMTPGLGLGDFSTAMAVQMAAAVLEGAANYQPNTIQRATLTPQGALRVSTQDHTAWAGLDFGWGTRPWAASPWG